MLLLLPPSETKRDGGHEGSALDLAALAFPELTAHRRTVIAAVRRLSRSVAESTRVLKLGPTQRFEIERNRTLSTSPTMPAMDRFTGVLFEGLDAPSLPDASRQWLASTTLVQSAMLGPIGVGDLVPAYRLSHDSRLPGLSLARHWSAAGSAAIASRGGLVLDLRSEGYAALSPAPERDDVRYVRVVTEESGGALRALNHFNKKAKGELARALALDVPELETVEALLGWAADRRIHLGEAGDGRELRLVV